MEPSDWSIFKLFYYHTPFFIAPTGLLSKIWLPKGFHNILKLMNLEIGEHSSFFQLLKKILCNVLFKNSIFIDIDWKCLETTII